MRKVLTLSLLVLAAFASLTCAGNRKPAAAADPSQFAREAFKASFQEAERDTKFVLVDFYNDWC